MRKKTRTMGSSGQMVQTKASGNGAMTPCPPPAPPEIVIHPMNTEWVPGPWIIVLHEKNGLDIGFAGTLEKPFAFETKKEADKFLVRIPESSKEEYQEYRVSKMENYFLENGKLKKLDTSEDGEKNEYKDPAEGAWVIKVVNAEEEKTLLGDSDEKIIYQFKLKREAVAYIAEECTNDEFQFEAIKYVAEDWK
jgi:hypothetical protein